MPRAAKARPRSPRPPPRAEGWAGSGVTLGTVNDRTPAAPSVPPTTRATDDERWEAGMPVLDRQPVTASATSTLPPSLQGLPPRSVPETAPTPLQKQYVLLSVPVLIAGAVAITALELGGPTFVHTLDPCPKGWDYHPQYSQELGHLAVECGIWPLYEVIDGVCNLTGPTRQIAEGRKKRKPVYEYLKRQGRFAHFLDEDVEHFQAQVDKMWTEWLIPGVIPFTVAAKDQTILKIDKKPLHEQKTA